MPIRKIDIGDLPAIDFRRPLADAEAEIARMESSVQVPMRDDQREYDELAKKIFPFLNGAIVDDDCSNSYSALLLYATEQSNLFERIDVRACVIQRLIATGHAYDGNISLDDSLAARNLFRVHDMCVRDGLAETPLSSDYICGLHEVLMFGMSRWVPEKIGRLKEHPDIVGGAETAPPEKVASALEALVARWNSLSSPTINDIAEFHISFERIHPFADGNGRIGRALALMQAVSIGEQPFMIEHARADEYYRCFTEPDGVRILADLMRDGQRATDIYFDES